MSKDVSVCILDYGSGNVRSVENIISYLGYDVNVSNDKERIREASHLILPGVGAFGSAMKQIREKIPLMVLEDSVFGQKKPILGICVGMQVFSDLGHEHGQHAGLGWIPGEVMRIDSNGLPLPHMGWNDIDLIVEAPLFKRLGEHRNFYFVHSYAFMPENSEVVSSQVDYGSKFCASIQSENIFGVQFHPEKSQKAGQLLFQNFLSLE